MERIGIADYDSYADYLAQAPDECDQLFNTILINYTAFFRDPQAWTTIAATLVPRIAAHKPPHARLRIWSAGCATGQEPYSMAMLLAEAFGMEHLAERATIYATDVDDDALQQVRQARYLPWFVRMVPPALLERYFVRDGAHYLVREELRRAVVAERHNLITDTPIPRIDLLFCRNVLIYLNAATQRRVIAQLRGALTDNGVLVLGQTELSLPAHHGLRWVSQRHRIVASAPDFSGATIQLSQIGDSAYL
jgi:two-component system CheB/CheR fusion protein